MRENKSHPVPVIWKAPRLGWHMRIKDGRRVWGLSFGGGGTQPWWRLTRAGAERKAARIIRSIERDEQRMAAERDALTRACRN